MPKERLQVLFLSELFPNPAWPAFGIFVERQAFHLQAYCHVTVMAPVRVFPHLRLWQHLLRPRHFQSAWQHWRTTLAQIPLEGHFNGLAVSYPRYTSPPRQGFHGLWGFFAYPALRRHLMALNARKKFDLIHAHYASPSGVIALLTRRWLKIPVVLSIHGSDLTYTVKQNPLSAAIIRWVFRNVDAIIANSSWTARQIAHYGADPQKITIIRLGGNPPASQLAHQPAPSLTAGPIKLLSVGYLEKRKGHAYVLQAMAELIKEGYQLHYTIVGSGTEETNLRRLTEQLGLTDVVTFAGYKAHSDVWPYYAACDLFVLPSWDEAFGVVYIEALALAKPIIGCAGEGGPEDLHSLAGCIQLVKPRDVASLMQALKQLVADPARRQRMGEAGRHIVAQYFTWERNAADTWQLYQQLMERETV